MAAFPQTPEYTGLNTPLGAEYDLHNLKVEGVIPADVKGVFFRAVPDPAYPPFIEDGGAILSGDGMISAIRFAADDVSISMRYVQTVRHEVEAAAGEAVYGKYRNPFTDKPVAAGLDRTVANTTPIWHGGRLLLAKEDGRPYRVDPATLATVGSYDFDGKLQSQTSTAHGRVDPDTGELFMFGYEADGLASRKIAYFIVDKDGILLREQWFDAPYCAMMHDFAITENYVLFPIYPTTADLDRLKAGGDHWVHHMDIDSWVGVMPRYGDTAELRWFKGPKGVFCYHMMNAHEDAEGLIHFDQCLSNVNAFPFVQRASGLNIPAWEADGRLERWTINLTDGSDTITAARIGPSGDFPIIPAHKQGRPLDYGWMLTMDPDMRAPPFWAGRWGPCSTGLFAWISTVGLCKRSPCHRPIASMNRSMCPANKPGMKGG
ncbi:carotenoid oxygenase family protein [Sphingobium sp. CR2-8]|uniref:carotenoid oxygenase family protein n=1 Tax=Sphingobium sp. CR2-8 TaxID=1306534 RepID=UPI002DBCCD50|nr:carotenoid oxygenase family protein [Sphingobium sp. CR2-8]MEC3910955.1 carotenoid oxygenase family protein [Sphingobium sp. CR2-8]